VKSNLALKILSLIDLTSLNEIDTDASIANLCQKAQTPFGSVAAVCVYPQFVETAKKALFNTSIKIATVANFPQGNDPIDKATTSITQSIEHGADEIDLVFPFKQYLAGEIDTTIHFIQTCKAICGEKIILKVILETGMFEDTLKLAEASRDALLGGADFLKTSTGKIEIGATPESATTLLMAIKQMLSEPLYKQHPRPLGFKVSGGVRTIEQAEEYISLTNQILGPEWINPRTFRLGASQLLDKIVEKLISLKSIVN